MPSTISHLCAIDSSSTLPRSLCELGNQDPIHLPFFGKQGNMLFVVMLQYPAEPCISPCCIVEMASLERSVRSARY